MRSEWHWFVPCDLQIFSGCVCHLEQLHAQSPFLFPIVFSINDFFAQDVDWCLKDCDKQRLQTIVFINVWKVFAGHTGDWPDVKTASICTTELWDALKIFILNSLRIKGSVERSLLPWAVFLIFTRNRSWKSEDYLCTLFFIEMSKERLEKSERTLPVSWRPWALAYSPDWPYNFSCLSAVSKDAVLAVFSRRLRGVIWRGKAFREQQCQFLTRNKSLSSENESNCSMTSECVRTDSILPRGAGLEHGRCKQSILSLSIFGILVERLSF